MYLLLFPDSGLNLLNGFDFFILVYFELRDTENQQLGKNASARFVDFYRQCKWMTISQKLRNFHDKILVDTAFQLHEVFFVIQNRKMKAQFLYWVLLQQGRMRRARQHPQRYQMKRRPLRHLEETFTHRHLRPHWTLLVLQPLGHDRELRCVKVRHPLKR